MKKVCDNPVQGRDAAKCMLVLHQWSCSMVDYSVEFRTLAVDSAWNEESLQGVFLKGLSDKLDREINSREINLTPWTP